MIQKLIKTLEDLKNAKFSPNKEYLKYVWIVDDFLCIIFEMEITQIKLSDDEKNIIGPLIYDSLNALNRWLYHFEDELHEGVQYREERSGLQFLFDKYQDLPTGTGNFLKDAFKEFIDYENVEGFDNKLKIIQESYLTDMFYDIGIPDPDLKNVPKTHWWWKQI